jgi:hypothetical protein
MPDQRLSIRHDSGNSAVPYVGGALLGIRKVSTLVGVHRRLGCRAGFWANRMAALLRYPKAPTKLRKESISMVSIDAHGLVFEFGSAAICCGVQHERDG